MQRLKLIRKPTQQQQQQQQQKPAASKLTKSNSIAPAHCPQLDCDQILLASNFLQHYLRDHSHLNFIAIEDRETMLFQFEESAFPLNEPFCLGILAYGGREPCRPENRPAAVGYATENQFLPQQYKYLKDFLPVLVMGCRTTRFQEEEVAVGAHPEGEERNVSLMFWLLTMSTSVPLLGYLSVSDVLLRHQRRSMVKLRELTNSSSEFPGIGCLSKEWNLLQLQRKEIDVLSHGGTSLIKLEVMIDGPC
ncbi:uncharacterized protein LOC121595784 [Anopheles merus]|uniref:uncharacterized protein LOC121595784 n=1 Tax=Anopheles merus TaxID=30066 RepID=UPI001BE433C9|nr:uncharacterized protein LOC121595784 [Anopheles merus]